MFKQITLLAVLCVPCSAHAEEAWLTHSQNLLNALEGHARPVWLDSNPYQSESKQQVLEIFKASKAIVVGADSGAGVNALVKPDKPLRVMFISFSLGDSVLKDIFQEAAGQDDVLLVLRGTKPQQKLPELFAELKTLLKDIDPVPNIVIDPTRFQKWAVTSVPDIVVEDHGKATLRVKGVTSLAWLKSRQEAGRHGDLGRFGAIYAIAEIDLLDAIKHRLATMDWVQKQHQAIARFWEQRQFEVLPVARENRDRLIDLSVTAPRDLMTPEGTLIVRAGQTVNPLDKLAFRLCLMVFDATEKIQVESVRHWSCWDQNARVLYLATQLPRQDGWDGLKRLETTLKAPVYVLTPDVRQRFQLQAVPTLVEQSGHRVLVRERKVALTAPVGQHAVTGVGEQ